MLRFPEAGLSLANRALDYAVFGHEATTKKMVDFALRRHGERAGVRQNLQLVRSLVLRGREQRQLVDRNRLEKSNHC